jgi:hypothetical protein
MHKSIHGTVRDRDTASKVVDSLKQAGFESNNISILMSDKRETRDFAVTNETQAPEGAATGAGTGAILGGALGWLTGIGAIAIPGVGPLIAAGPIMAALSGAVVGGAVGGIAGALIGMGIPEEDAQRYESSVKLGKALISVHAKNDEEAERAREVMAMAGAHDITTSAEAASTSSFRA